ncbi:protein neuralized [Elysia marginata]|uniref:Protein neuralized n=1 Tax=Elysia marginata TaxID=1093978 RepID=A0AAV4H0P7_9GAST|nr:protein neuralized [Elysia marginata]
MTGDLNSLRAPALQFHDVHGDNIELLCNKSRARRHESFCKGICFSNRPININERLIGMSVNFSSSMETMLEYTYSCMIGFEKRGCGIEVYVKFVETNTSWSGVLRFGFTSVNPATLRGADLPRYACPDLTNKPGNWAKALGERYTASNILLHFSVNRAGDVNYGVNGEEKGLFFSGVATDQPVWAMLDIYGNTVGVEFSHANAEIEPGQFDASPVPVVGPDDVFSFNSLSLEDQGVRGSGGPAAVMTPHTPSTPPGLSVQGAPLLQYHAGINFNPLPFHTLVGRNIRVSADRRVALRMPDEYCNAYVFTGRPISCGETVVLQVLSIDRSFIGGLGFGLTACDPSTVDPSSLPDDSDHLLDRLEYWVVNKDVCRNPEVGDEIREVKYARNNQAPVTLMHVDRTLPLWAFFDVYGNIQKVHLVGATTTLVQGRLARSQSMATSRLVTGAPNSISSPPLRSNSVPAQCLPSPQEPNLRPFLGDPHQHHPQRPSNHPMHSLSQQQHQHRPSQQPMSAPCTPLGVGDRGPPDDLAMDCKVCWEKPVNCVLYTCGHMCLCFECAVKIRSQNGLCPICRQAIVDVIKTYRS